jgi:hypothetical protein
MGETLGQVLGAIGTGLQVYGAVSSGNTARGAKEYEAAQYRYKAASIYGHDIPLKQYEADLLEKQAQAAEEEGEIARQAARIKLAILEKETEGKVGTSRARLAAAGVDVGTGSPLDAMADIMAEDAVKAGLLRMEGDVAAWKGRQEASRLRSGATIKLDEAKVLQSQAPWLLAEAGWKEQEGKELQKAGWINAGKAAVAGTYRMTNKGKSLFDLADILGA